MSELPTLYSFRRCPYAMRARLAIAASNQNVELREVVLRDKPDAMLVASPKGTVPVLVLQDGAVLEESLDVMEWAIRQNDSDGLRTYPDATLQEMEALVAECDGPFKSALDRYKYPNRYEGAVAAQQREKGARFIRALNAKLEGQSYLFGERFSFADCAILPFVRQFAHVDKEWFWSEDWPNVISWLEAFLSSDRLANVMAKYNQWHEGDARVCFP